MKVIGSNPGYLLKFFLLYKTNQIHMSLKIPQDHLLFFQTDAYYVFCDLYTSYQLKNEWVSGVIFKPLKWASVMHWRWRWWDQIQAIFLIFFYFKKQIKFIWHWKFHKIIYFFSKLMHITCFATSTPATSSKMSEWVAWFLSH